MIKFITLLCLVSSCSVYAKSIVKSVDQQFIQTLYAHRQHLANGFNGVLQPLDPLSLGNFSLNVASEFGIFVDALHHASMTGLTSFDKAAIRHSNGLTTVALHVPEVNFTSHYTNHPSFLGETDGILSATLNDIHIAIIASITNNGKTVEDVNVFVHFNGKVTNVTLNRVNGGSFGERYLRIITPRLEQNLIFFLNAAALTYQSSINEQATEYLNKHQQLYPIPA